MSEEPEGANPGGISPPGPGAGIDPGVLTADVVESMARHLDVARGERPWPFRHPGAVTRADRLWRCRQDPAFGWHFVGALDVLGLPLPDALEQDSVRQAWWWSRHGVDSPPLVAALSLRDPASSHQAAILQAFLLCEDASWIQIAEWLDRPVETIRIYNDLFFNVRGRRDDRPFLAHLVYPETRIVHRAGESCAGGDLGPALLRAAWESGASEVRFLAGLDKGRSGGAGSDNPSKTDFEGLLLQQADLAMRYGRQNSGQLLQQAASWVARRQPAEQPTGPAQSIESFGEILVESVRAVWNNARTPGAPDWWHLKKSSALEQYDDVRRASAEEESRPMSADTIRWLASYLDEARGERPWPFQSAAAGDRTARIERCLADPAFGWHFVRAAHALDIPLPDDLHLGSMRRAYHWLRYGLEDEPCERAYAFSHPAAQRLRRLLNAFLLCETPEMDELAGLLCEPVAALHIYADLFFNVRDRRAERPYLAGLVYPATRLAGLRDGGGDLDVAAVLWRAAFESGHGEVSALAGLVSASEERKNPVAATPGFADHFMGRAAMTLRYGRPDVAPLLKQAARLAGRQKPQSADAADLLSFRKLGEMMLEDIREKARRETALNDLEGSVGPSGQDGC